MSRRILIVDDNVNLTTLLSKALGKYGYEVVVENDSLHSIEMARRSNPNLILLDVMMPNLDGGDILAILRQDPQLRKIPVILLTALAREASGLGNLGGIQSPVLGKPIELSILMQEIENQLAQVPGTQLPLQDGN